MGLGSLTFDKSGYMHRLNPARLHITCLKNTSLRELILPRRYTLTHSDSTRDIFLSIGSEYNRKQISRLYTRFMRDEVLIELFYDGKDYILRVFCHVSGGFILGTAGWRSAIFHAELPLVLEAMRYGDRFLFENKPELDNASVQIHFQSKHKKYYQIENWGPVSRYRKKEPQLFKF
jgi:hypothetical protein